MLSISSVINIKWGACMKVKYLIIAAITTFLIIKLPLKPYVIVHQYDNYLDIALEHIDLTGVDIPFIVETVDTACGYEVQLNWKEVLTLIAINRENNLYNLDETIIKTAASRFIDGERVKSLDEVLVDSLYTNEERERAKTYMEDLKYEGYTPHKLQPSAKETLFINQLVNPAKINYRKTGILPSITIAQAILESNWGQSELSRNEYNLFGIKADDSWDGDYATYTTTEYDNEVIDTDFREYDNWLASIEDHANFLLNNECYHEAGVFDAKNYRIQAKAIEVGGYSTAVDIAGNLEYAKRLCELIRQYNLQLLDHEVMHN